VGFSPTLCAIQIYLLTYLLAEVAVWLSW